MTTSSAPTPSAARGGAQLTIRHGDQLAVVTEVGATLRQYAVDGRDVIASFGEDELPPACNGWVLVPWPNRLEDGQYSFGGHDYQLPLTEPGRTVALHGLAYAQHWRIEELTTASATLSLRLPGIEGYPFDILTTVTYSLADDGLHVETATTNVGGETAPFGIGFHPWLATGGGPVDETTLQIPARTHVVVDDGGRLLPRGTEEVSGDYDLREPKSLAGVALDDAWLDPIRESDGSVQARFGRTDGRTTEVWADEFAVAWQACTGDAVAPAFRRHAVAVEPMSCIANAFRTGEHLIQLEPGDTFGATWGLRLLSA